VLSGLLEGYGNLIRLAGLAIILLISSLLSAACTIETDTSLVQPNSNSVVAVGSTNATQIISTAAAGNTEVTSVESLDLEQFTSRYGYHSGCDKNVRLEIKSLGVNATICNRFVPIGSNMPNPYGPADVAMYDLTQWNRLGGTPGSGGNTILAGHVDYNATVPYADTYYRGPGIFQNLRFLSQGDKIEIHIDDEVYIYEVIWRRAFDAEVENWRDAWTADVPVESVTLYTCGGTFDVESRKYSDRLVVRAQLLPQG
jgi:hypothetical protein